MDSDQTTSAAAPEGGSAQSRPDSALQMALRVIVMVLGALGVIMAINQQFLLNIFLSGSKRSGLCFMIFK